MNSFYPILFFLALSFNVFAQNWSPIVEGDVYHYELVGDTSTYDSIVYNDGFNNLNVLKSNSPVAATIWVDSVNTDLTGINTSHLNKIVKRCDTCSAISGYSQTYLQNQSQFLGSDMVITNDCEYIFTLDNELFLKPCAPVGATWIFEYYEGIFAEVVSITEVEIFGNIDSLKHVALSNGDTIILSKSHGIIEFPQLDNNMYYRLMGIQTRDLGFKIPDYREFFDFNVGDVFQYNFHNGGKHGGRYGTAKIKVTGRQDFQDSIVYEINRIMYQANYETVGYYYEQQVTSESHTEIDYTHTFAKNNIADLYPRQLFNLNELGCIELAFDNYENDYWEQSYVDCHYQQPDESFTGQKHMLYYGQDENDNWLKFMYSESWINARIHSHFQATTSSNDLLINGGCTDQYYRKWQEGLGETILYHWCFEGYISRGLSAYVIDGDTTGTIISDEVLLTNIFTPNENENWQLTLSPNPATNILQFDIQSDKHLQNTQMKIYDSLGKIFITQEIDGQQSGSIHISNLPNGIYFISFQNSEGMISRKFVKSK